ncbi:tetratricopeptide repeat protein 6 isoform X3 [Artibeus jamaicensis]|uniref:tetratricopeptide repeat protein 6 isoform X3 n=1 Tax=Artibeus jamaicensis TaxID=9417 RepID=UPI00235ADE91|nr:tetratricopeptide repeat protein 6 isoform X3 [Artibeus jamaicensis]
MRQGPISTDSQLDLANVDQWCRNGGQKNRAREWKRGRREERETSVSEKNIEPSTQEKLIKMSTISKHFGLNYKEELYIFKELEKIRQKTKKDFLQFKQKLASKPAVDELPVFSLQDPGPARAGQNGSVFSAGPQQPSGSPRAKGPTVPTTALLQQALLGTVRPLGRSKGAAPGKPQVFCPQDFYMRSSAFLRHRLLKHLPAIATSVGTSRPLVPMPPPARRRMAGGLWVRRSLRLSGAKQVANLAQGRAAKPEPAAPAEARTARERKRSSTSSAGGEVEAAKRQRRVRIRTHHTPERTPRSFSKADSEIVQRDEGLEAVLQAPLPVRVIPTSIEEIIASLQSEAQLASDRTIRDLIQSVLGQNYDIQMEDISLMGKMYWHKTSQVQSEQGLQIIIEEPQMNELEESPKAVPGTSQIDQEDVSEKGASETESVVFKPQETSEIQPADESSKLLEDKQPIPDSKAAKQASLKVKSSELLQIRGKEVKQTRKSKLRIPLQKKSTKSRQDQKLLKQKVLKDRSSPTFHSLCTTVPAWVLPTNLYLASRVYHTADKKGHDTLLRVFGKSLLDDCFTDEEQKHRALQGIPVTGEDQAHVPALPTAPGRPPESEEGTRQCPHKPHLQLLGEEVSAYPGFTKLFWNPNSSKFYAPVSVMKETLYPKYESIQTSRILIEKISRESKESIIALNQFSGSHRFFLPRKSSSVSNIQQFYSMQSPKLKRVNSLDELRKEATTALLEIKDDVQSSIREVMFQKAKELERHQMMEQTATGEASPVKENIDAILDIIQDNRLRNLSVSLIEASRKAGISYIVYPKKKKLKWKKGQNFTNLPFVLHELSKPPNILKRPMSHGILPGEKKCLLRVPLYERPIRCPSVPSLFNFDKFVQSMGGIPENTDTRTWVLDIFSKHKPRKTATKEKVVNTCVQKDLSNEVKEAPKLELSDSLECDLPPEVIKHFESEVEILTEEINNKKVYSAFPYCRRGALYRKLGKLQSAMNDLQKAILLEPLLLNAFWHRHLIYLFQDKINEALDDLNYISKYNKNNAEAYLSKAEIYRRKKDITLAILNYTQAIKCKPTDADIYFRRGEMYEITNRVLAMDDFSKCILYDPTRTDALLKRGLFYYENESWSAAIQDFTALIDRDPQNSQARTYRGRAYFKRRLYKQATQDLSVAIHLDPNNWLALYYRACLLRKSNPFRALQDYSVSALINDGYENFGCFLHRGVLYADLKHWLLAISDFETVISLERTVTLAYINIGLIHLLHLNNYTEAIWYFSEALKYDPSCIQSYICRAETYHKVHKLKKAVRELSRAIHLHPDGIQLYIIRGQYLLKMKCYDLAKFTIYQVAEMNKGIIELSPVQQALIYSFCENHDEAVQVLDRVTLTKPDVAMYTLLAKAQMKAKRNKEAVRMFKKALDVFAHSNKGPNSLEASADCLYNLGLCYMDEGNLQMAFDSFTKAVKTNPNFAEGFYQRGLCKMKLHKDTSILDFNHAITLNSKYYEAYLSRVAFYGLKGRYSKAILNCNEAIKIYPHSVRAYIYRGVLKYHNKTYKLAITDLTTAINMDKNCYIAFYNRALCHTRIGINRLWNCAAS